MNNNPVTEFLVWAFVVVIFFMIVEWATRWISAVRKRRKNAKEKAP